jgi:phage baseplate assembly protein gpV
VKEKWLVPQRLRAGKAPVKLWFCPSQGTQVSSMVPDWESVMLKVCEL